MKIPEIIEIIHQAGLSLPPAFRAETPEALARFYNGVGADWFPGWLRRLVTLVLERLEPLAYIHDVEFATSPRTYWAFTMAQLRWAYNALKLFFYYSHERIRFLVVALLCAICCQFGGWWGFKSEGGK